ncbi:glycosyltransferase [Pseudorhodoplanes sp.]|uniref:glycosyltransferase n=1 Tax=Pseudorhodoplanes sp. TaxID=1934341 RepID=UPI00391BFF9D
MSIAILALTLFAAAALGLHLLSVAVAMRRCRPTASLPTPAPDSPPVSIVLPVCGLENYIEDTLRSAFRLDYPRYELIFCAARPDDAVVPLVQRLMADHRWIDARLLIGDERISDNPKLNNVFKGWREATHPFVSICDSNVLLPRDYIQRLLSRFDAETGLVCSPPIGCRPDGFFAEVECAMLNNYQARWQYFADAIGFGFAQGKTLFWRKSDLERAGGIRALAAESAEDAACTKIVRGLGLKVRLMQPPVRQPLGFRKARDVWKRQRRWARLRRASFPFWFSLEIFSGALPPLVTMIAAALLAGVSPLMPALAFVAAWYGAEWLLSVKSGWPAAPRLVAACMLRDAMLPVLYVNAWLGRGFEWRGHDMRAVEGARLS